MSCDDGTTIVGGTHVTTVDGGAHSTTVLANTHATIVGEGECSVTLLSTTSLTVIDGGQPDITTVVGGQHLTVLDTGIGPRGPEGPAGVLNLAVEANCLASDAVDDCVCITGPSVAGKYQVTRADPFDVTKMPAVGMIVSKASPTECMVMLAGVFVKSGLTVGKLHFVSTAGTLTAIRPTPSGVPVLVQAMGKALDSNKLALMPANHITRLIP